MDRALSLFELLAHSQTGLTLSEVSRKLRIPKSTAHYLIHTLETRGYVQRVLENTVVYDRLSPAASIQLAGPTRHISAYLGKARL